MFGRVYVCLTGICIYSKRGNVYIVNRLFAKLLSVQYVGLWCCIQVIYNVSNYIDNVLSNNQYTFIDALPIKHKNLSNGINKKT